MSLRNRSRSPAVRTATPAIEHVEGRQLFSGTLPTAADLRTAGRQVPQVDWVCSADVSHDSKVGAADAPPTVNVNAGDPVGGDGVASGRTLSRPNLKGSLVDLARRSVQSAVTHSGAGRALQRL